jgi:preprotein translocase subunit YajC
MRATWVVLWQLALTSAVWAQAKSGPAKGAPDMTGMFLMMGVVLVIMYVLMIRPEQKKQKARQAMLSSLKKGMRVVTTGGIHGTVGHVKDKTIMVKVADQVTLEFSKAAVAGVDEGEVEVAAELEQK